MADFQEVTKKKKPINASRWYGVLFHFAYNSKLSTLMKNKTPSLSRQGFFFCRGEKTRTSGPYVPNVVRYQLRHTPLRPPKPLRRRSNIKNSNSFNQLPAPAPESRVIGTTNCATHRFDRRNPGEGGLILKTQIHSINFRPLLPNPE
jgi:hypothetical protein